MSRARTLMGLAQRFSRSLGKIPRPTQREKYARKTAKHYARKNAYIHGHNLQDKGFKVDFDRLYASGERYGYKKGYSEFHTLRSKKLKAMSTSKPVKRSSIKRPNLKRKRRK